MPYILKERRRKDMIPVISGELNYKITELINNYIFYNGGKLSYAVINEVIGALECAKLELYRRIAAPYEDEKVKENGDVYGKILENT